MRDISLNKSELPEADARRLNHYWQTAAYEVIAAQDSEQFFQAQYTYFVSVFAVTGTTSPAEVDADVLNGCYNEGIELACQRNQVEAPLEFNFDADWWRRTFRVALADIHKPAVEAMPDSLAALMDKLLYDPKQYYHEHGKQLPNN